MSDDIGLGYDLSMPVNSVWFRKPNSIEFKKLVPEATIPTRGNKDDAGYDLYLLNGHLLGPGRFARLRTGIAVDIKIPHQIYNVDFSPEIASAGLIRARSSAFAKGLMIQGLIDQGYRCELFVQVWNISQESVKLSAGDRIAQLVIVPSFILPTVEVQELSESDRGTGGFGSTGK